MSLFVSWVILFGAVSVYAAAGGVGLIGFGLLGLSVTGGVISTRSRRHRRAVAAAEERHLAAEREVVRQSMDLVMDPGLTEEERLVVIDGFIPGHAGPVHRDRFVVVEELSPPSQELLARARSAALVVGQSQAKRLGLLDGVANDQLLPQQLWEIARLLGTQSSLQQEQDAARQGVVTPELEAVLKPQQAALERSVGTVTDRVRGLERYARRVQEADAALRAREALANNGKYQALLAHTDDAAGMRELAAHSDALEATLAKSVREAIEAGQTLAL